MDIVFYIIIFVIGALLGSFYATATKRMLKNKKVINIRSYCAKCGEKLHFFEKIPIISYIFLKGKCKYCKKKIDAKYIILEIITGLLFLIAAYSFNIGIFNLNSINLISFITIILYVSYIILAIIADKENRCMPPEVFAYGVLIALIYIIYMCIVENASIYNNIAYLLIMTFLLLVNILSTKKRAQSSYLIDLLTMLLIMLIFTGKVAGILTITGTLLSIALYIFINKIKDSKTKGKKSKNTYSANVKIIFIMGILNLLIFLTLINI